MSQIENGILEVAPNESKYHWGLIVLTVLLVFIPLANILSLCLLFPYALYSNSVRKERALLYEDIAEGVYNSIYCSYNERYNIKTTNNDPYGDTSVGDKVLFFYKNRFLVLVGISTISFILQLFFGGIFAFVGFSVLGILATSYGRERARSIVAEELIDNPELKVVFPDGFEADIKTSFDEPEK